MRNLSLLVIGLIVSFSAFSQEKMNVTVCEKPANTIHLNHLLECKMLTVDNPNYKVNSFTLGFKSGNDYIEVKMTDNVVSDKIIDKIKEVNPEYIYIEQIVLVNKKGEKLNLEPFKVKK